MEIVNRNRVKHFITKDGSEIKEMLAPRNSSLKTQSLAEAKVLTGKVTRQHRHIKTEEIYHILQDKAKIGIDDEIREVSEEAGIAVLPRQKHRIVNTGTEELLFLYCYSPSYSDNDTVIS